MTLAEFMTAQLDEDQQQAEKLMRFAQDTHLAFQDHKRFLGRDVPGWHTWPDVEAMCGRALADIKAKRGTLALHQPQATILVSVADGEGFEDVAPDSFEEIVGRDVVCMACAGYPAAPCQTLLLLAAPFKGRPGWQAAWEVQG
jgi:hypothetical protein